MTEAAVLQPQSLSFKHLYNHFFLLHDFFHKITKSKANNSDYFDLQIEVYNTMTSSVRTGSKVCQGLCFGSLCYYFLKGKSIKLRFLYGFLFVYWYNHIITLGSYAGAFVRIPSVYKRTSLYYQKHPEVKDMISKLNILMQKEEMYEDTQIVLSQLFEDKEEEKSFVSNDFFIKNKDKYLPKEVLEPNYQNNKKLRYFDSFLTRYIYYSFERWAVRMKQFLVFYQSD